MLATQHAHHLHPQAIHIIIMRLVSSIRKQKRWSKLFHPSCHTYANE